MLRGVILDAFFMIFDAILNGLQGVILEAFFMILDVILDGFWNISDVFSDSSRVSFQMFFP